ncbi:type II toxin-antitoxin system PemK/MazF family toxin [Anaerovoracaceae bacterium 41-7]
MGNRESKQQIKMGEIYWVRLHGKNHVQNGWHPAIVTQNNIGNTFSDTVVVVPITTKRRKSKLPTHIDLPNGIGGLARPSTAQCEGQRPVSKDDFGKYIGTLDDITMRKISMGCLINTPYQTYISEEDLMLLKENRKIC